jgi:DNA polymerase III alpha subunit (gram-positive type)
MSNLKFYICDTETTGLDSKKHEVDEISIIRCDDRVQLTEFIKCDYPERASYDALKVTGKTLEDLKKGSSKEDVINKINKFLEQDGATRAHRCFIGHKVISFDKKFIHALYEKVNQELPVDLWMDTWEMMKAYTKISGMADQAKKDKTKLSLTLINSCDLLGIKKFANAHSSKVDTRNNYLLYKDLIENKNIDYLPFVKSFIHSVNDSSNLDGEGLDPDLLDL